MTAPEISQIFGELIGLWCVVTWRAMGEPEPVHVIELGPGRGTMMRDMVRAVSRIPRFPSAAQFHLSEPSPRLRLLQAETLVDAPLPVSHIAPGSAPKGATIMVANEVLDCLAIDQLVRSRDGQNRPIWLLRTVELDANGTLQFGTGRPVEPPSASQALPAMDGDILEISRTRDRIGALSRDHADHSFAALFVDYGHTETGTGDTLQALRGHAYEHPLTSPGEADLTAHVDFAQVADAATSAGLAVDGPVTQAEFLGRLGIIERASRLMSANPAKAADIEAGVARLLAPAGMGTRFKAIGLRSRELGPLPGLG